MGGWGAARQGLHVRTLHVDYTTAAGGTLTKYSEIWVVGAANVVQMAVTVLLNNGLWIGFGLQPGPSHASCQFGVGVRDAYLVSGGPPASAPASFPPNPKTIVDPDTACKNDLVSTFGPFGSWHGIAVPAIGTLPAGVHTDGSNMSLYVKWEIRQFQPHNKRGAFQVARVVANPRNVTFAQNYVLGLSVLTRDRATGQIDYFDTEARTFL